MKALNFWRSGDKVAPLPIGLALARFVIYQNLLGIDLTCILLRLLIRHIKKTDQYVGL
jgi:hypothetical protein